ncbi:MAG TPA: hypothetical protein VF092_21070 [Longimicrobium sp.]
METSAESPSARFRVNGVFSLRSRSIFVVHGEITEGTVRIGQRVLSPEALDAPVHALEFVLVSATTGQDDLALVFRFPDEETLARWTAAVEVGMEIVLEDRDGAHECRS